MSDFYKAYKFVKEWLWDCRKYGSTRRTVGREWDNQRLCDVADIAKDYAADLQAENEQLRETVADFHDQFHNGIKYDEKLNLHIVVWTDRQLEKIRLDADEVYKKLEQTK